VSSVTAKPGTDVEMMIGLIRGVAAVRVYGTARATAGELTG
jgi:hypothetical protein